MGVVRAFVACELSSTLQDAVEAATASLRAGLGSDLVRWVRTRNIHLTLKFLGDVSPSSLDLVRSVLGVEAARRQPFDMLVEGLGAFPSPRRPRVLWVGLKGPTTLSLLQRELDSATAELGYKSEERQFSPHLTIGYVRPDARASYREKVRGELARIRLGVLGSQHVDAIHLFKSDLQPTGAVYTKLLTARLGKA